MRREGKGGEVRREEKGGEVRRERKGRGEEGDTTRENDFKENERR